LRAELAKIQSELDELIPQLSHHELVSLQQDLTQIANADDDEIAVLRAVSQEEEAARTTKTAPSVVISRVAAAALFEEAERRIRKGAWPSSAGLLQEAILTAYGGE
jgi:hypothetical protein